MDKDALVKIFDLYSAPLYKYALRLCSDPVMADHIVGDVFAKLLDQFSAGDGPRSNLRSYLYEMVYHRIIDEARFRKRRTRLEVATWLVRDPQPAFQHLDDPILLQQLLHAIQTELTEDQRHVMIFRFLEDFSLRETAAIMGKTVEHVKVIQGRALARLRRSLERKEVRERVPLSKIIPIPKPLGI